MIDNLERQNQAIENEIESVRQESQTPKHTRKPKQIIIADTTNTQSYTNENILTQGVKAKITYDEEDAITLATIMYTFAQTYSLKGAVTKFENKSKEAAYTEMEQLHKRESFKPMKVSEMTEKEKTRALYLLVFIT